MSQLPSSPDPRYYKDGSGLRPKWRMWFRYPRLALWLSAPRWYVRWRCRRWDRAAIERRAKESDHAS